jgi:hypothetical protein
MAEQDRIGLHRLSDMLVEEVSVVDRAANKRRFLVVKRDGSTNMVTELHENADGTFQTSAQAAPAQPDSVQKSDAEAPQPDAPAAVAAPTEPVPVAAPAEPAPAPAPEPAPAEAVAAPAAVEKVGAKMAKDRYTRLKQAIDMLVSVLNELEPMPDPGMKAAASAPSSTPADKACQTKKTEEGQTAVLAAIEKLANQVGTVASIAKSAAAEVASIKQARGPSHVQKAEGSDPTPTNGVSWPRDMTRPINRETVSKERGFWDE